MSSRKQPPTEIEALAIQALRTTLELPEQIPTTQLQRCKPVPVALLRLLNPGNVFAPHTELEECTARMLFLLSSAVATAE